MKRASHSGSSLTECERVSNKCFSKKNTLSRKIYTDEPLAAGNSRPRRRKKGWLGLALVGMGALSVVTVMVVLYLGLCTQIVERQYALDHYDALLPVVREQNANLAIQVRALSKPSRVEKIARTVLHMGDPKQRILIVQDEDEHPLPEYAWKGISQRIGSP